MKKLLILLCLCISANLASAQYQPTLDSNTLFTSFNLNGVVVTNYAQMVNGLNIFAFQVSNLVYTLTSCGVTNGIISNTVPTAASWGAGSSVFAHGGSTNASWTYQLWSSTTLPLLTIAQYFTNGYAVGYATFWGANCSTSGTYEASFLGLTNSPLGIIAVNPGNWLAQAPFAATTNVAYPFSPIATNIVLNAINNGVDFSQMNFNGATSNYVFNATAAHYLAASPWGIIIIDPGYAINGFVSYNYMDILGSFNQYMIYGVNTQASWTVVDTNGVPKAAIGFFTNRGYIIQPGNSFSNSTFDTGGGLTVYSNITLNSTLQLMQIGTNLAFSISGGHTNFVNFRLNP